MLSINKFDLEQLPFGVVQTDKKHIITSCNKAFLKLTGYSHTEVVGQHWLQWNTPTRDWGKVYTKFFVTKLSGVVHVKIYSQRMEADYINYVINVTEFIEKHKQLLERIKQTEKIIKEKVRNDFHWKNKMLINYKTICRPAIDQLRQNLDQRRMSICETCEYGIMACLSTYHTAIPHPLLVLSKSEIMVAKAIKSGRNSREIAIAMGVSIKTIENHRHRIRSKLSISNKDIELTNWLSLFELEH